MKWTKDKPAIPGWYWMGNYWNGVDVNIEIVEVFERPGHHYLCIEDPNSCIHSKRDFIAVAKIDTKWAGPIEPPKE